MSYFAYYYANNRNGMGYCKFGVGSAEDALALYVADNPQIGRKNIINLPQNPKDSQGSAGTKPYAHLIREEMVVISDGRLKQDSEGLG